MKTWHIVVTEIGGFIVAVFGAALEADADAYVATHPHTFKTMVRGDRPSCGHSIALP